MIETCIPISSIILEHMCVIIMTIHCIHTGVKRYYWWGEGDGVSSVIYYFILAIDCKSIDTVMEGLVSLHLKMWDVKLYISSAIKSHNNYGQLFYYLELRRTSVVGIFNTFMLNKFNYSKYLQLYGITR